MPNASFSVREAGEARRKARTKAIVALSKTAAFRPGFLSSLGDFTVSNSFATIRETDDASRVGSREANSRIAALTAAVGAAGDSSQEVLVEEGCS